MDRRTGSKAQNSRKRDRHDLFRFWTKYDGRGLGQGSPVTGFIERVSLMY